jgi:exodeoxyribonuclease V alpha subunit
MAPPACVLSDLLQRDWLRTAHTPLTGLDTAFANFLHSQQASADPRHLWLAALTSHQWSRGHACLDLASLHSQAALLLGWSGEQTAGLPQDLCAAAASLPWAEVHPPNSSHAHTPDLFNSLSGTQPLVLHITPQHPQGKLYLRRAWTAEQTIRQQLSARLAQPSDVPADLAQRLDTLFPALADPTQTDMQRRACEVAAAHRVTRITGGPGTGKTTTVVRLLSTLVGAALGEKPLRIHLAAPTGKAAARLTESIAQALDNMPQELRGRISPQAHTLHRLLHLTGSPGQSQAAHQLATDVVVVDEASMVDLEMMARLLQAVPSHARLVLLGDKDQLASVEAGAVMSQLCTGSLMRECTVTLTHSHRFDARSGIGQWAQAVNRGDAHSQAELKALWQAAPDACDSLGDAPDVTRLQLTHAADPRLGAVVRQGWREWLALLAAHRDGQPCSDAQALALLHSLTRFCVLCAVREGPLGVTQLNAHLERALGLGQGAQPWYIGRPVMVTRNDYTLGLMNGDIGVCLPDPNGVVRVAFVASANDARQTGAVRWVAPSRLDAVDTVLAMTVHKSQGSEFEHVLLVLPALDAPVLSRELVYTGLTRARHRLTVWAPNTQVLWQACARRVLRSGGLGD